MRCDGVSTSSRERSAMDYRLYPVSDVLTASMSSRNHSSAATGPRDPRPSRTTSSRFCRTSIRGRTGVAGTHEGQPVRPLVDGAGTRPQFAWSSRGICESSGLNCSPKEGPLARFYRLILRDDPAIQWIPRSAPRGDARIRTARLTSFLIKSRVRRSRPRPGRTNSAPNG